jgi:hypothetical protein
LMTLSVRSNQVAPQFALFFQAMNAWMSTRSYLFGWVAIWGSSLFGHD